MAPSYRGEDLREIRISKGIALAHIAQKTRISKRYLEYIEGNDYCFFPCITYLRGYLSQYAECLDLNPSEVVSCYLESYIEWVNKQSSLNYPLL